jgi:hypothetical protein
MSWTTPRDWTVGEVVTETMMDEQVKGNLRYLKGLDGVPIIESGLTIDNTDGDERLLLPLLSTAECTTVLNAEGEVAFDEQTHRAKYYNGTAIGSVVTTIDVDDTPVDNATTDPISSNWAYDHLALLTTAGDIIYATAAGTWARLPIGTAGQRLRVNVGATAPEWAVTGQTQEFFVPFQLGTGGTDLGYQYSLDSGGDSVSARFRIPADFTTLTSVKVIMYISGTGTFDWTVATAWGASGEVFNVGSDSATADAQAGTNTLILELDISSAYTGIAAGDNVLTTFTLDALDTISSLNVMGFNIKYT